MDGAERQKWMTYTAQINISPLQFAGWQDFLTFESAAAIGRNFTPLVKCGVHHLFILSHAYEAPPAFELNGFLPVFDSTSACLRAEADII
jgi:hypothetical protein